MSCKGGIFVIPCYIRGFGVRDCKSLSDQQGFSKNLIWHYCSLERQGRTSVGSWPKATQVKKKKKKNRELLLGPKILRIFSLCPLKNGCSLSEIFKEADITDCIAESFPCSLFQKAKVLHIVRGTALSKREPQSSPACLLRLYPSILLLSLNFFCQGLFPMLVCCYSEKCGITGKDNHIVRFKLLQKEA